MNNTFHIKRFGLIIGKDFQESWKRYALQFLAMLGIIAIVLCFQYESDVYQQADAYFQVKSANVSLLRSASILFLAFGIVFASTLMEPMRNKTKRISYLSVPVSDLEKFLSRWVIVTIGYIFAFFLALWLADLFRVSLFSIRYPDLDVTMLNFGELINPSSDYENGYTFPNRVVFNICLSFFFLCQSICILGSTFWEKASFIKTFAMSAVIILSYLLISRWTILLFHKSLYHFFEMTFIGIQTENKPEITFISIFALFTLVNWTIAYFRFRESEIIKRW